MIVTREQAERLLGRDLRGSKYVGKRWFLLSRSLPRRNLGGFPTKTEAQQHERDVQYFKRNPVPSVKMSGGAAARRVWKILRDRKKASAVDLAAYTGMSVYDVENGLRWLEGHGYAKRSDEVYFPQRHAFAVNPSGNPKPFGEREHKWDEVLIEHKGKKRTRKQIRDHYKRVQKKIWPFLKGQTIMIVFAPAKNVFVRRRNDPSGKHIKMTRLDGIDDPKSYEYWINRRVIEFHPVLTTKSTPLLWLDLDMHKTMSGRKRKELFSKMRRSVPKLKKAFAKMGVKKVYVYDSGTDGGIHLEGSFPKKRKVDVARREFRKILDDLFEGDEVFTTGMAKAGQIRLDTTTFHYLGSLRAPYSMTVKGGVKKRI
jgi:hypothetical protein